MSGSVIVNGKATRSPRLLAACVAVGTLIVLAGELVIVPARSALSAVAFTLTCACGALLLAALARRSAGLTWRRLLIAYIILLDTAAVVAGAFLPMGGDFAVIAPLLGAVLLVASAEGRWLKSGLVIGWGCGVTGDLLARSTQEAGSIPGIDPAPIATAVLALGTALCYATLGWVASVWRESIAERSRAAEAARAAELIAHEASERLRVLGDSSPLPTLAFDTTGAVRAWNPAAERFLGWTAAEAIGMPTWEFVPERHRSAAQRRTTRSLVGATTSPLLATLRAKDGRELRVELHDGLERDAEGRPVGVVVQFLDVSEREAMAARLVEAQRLEAVGQLAGGIAHDFNNSLTAIAGFASLIASGDSPDPADDARTILAAAERAATLTRQLLAFSRRVPLQPQLTDLNDFLGQAEPLVRSLVGETIDVRLETAVPRAIIEVDQASLEQAVLNLAANARDAMPQGGELTLSVRAYESCRAAETAPAVSHLAVVISDTGVGIPSHEIDRIFEPFFTTKPVGKGTGLGLAMVHGFAAQSGGHVVVASPPGRGATFEIHFPEASDVADETPPHADPVGGTESILFVEDDPGVASFGLACLRRLGYDVTPVMNGSEAVALAATRSRPFDLLFADVVVPGMSGPELASLLHRHHPETAILFASGYGAETVDAAMPGGRVGPLLEKPYSLDQLASKVRLALDGRDGR
jgi:two-component system cell cycle sensor histidine kinase/response regulator CckA